MIYDIPAAKDALPLTVFTSYILLKYFHTSCPSFAKHSLKIISSSEELTHIPSASQNISIA
jgi:hypothetical protein